MTILEIKSSIALHKDAGHSSRVCLPITVLQDLIAKAEAYERIPKIAKEAFKA